MRLSALVLMGASSIALTGCSFLGGLFGVDKHHNTTAHHDGGSYYAHSDCGQTKCVGGREVSKWNFEYGAGPTYIVGGDAITGSETNAIPLQTINNVDMSDAYEDAYNLQAGVSKMLNPNRKLSLGYNYTTAAGQTLELGQEPGQPGPSTVKLSQYESHGVELGLRQYAMPRYIGATNLQYRPYVEGKLGAAYIDDITLITARPAGPNQDIDFYDAGWVPTAAALVGFEAPVFDRMTLGVETGIRYSGKLESAENLQAQSPNLGGSNNGSDMWTVPVTIRGRYRF